MESLAQSTSYPGTIGGAVPISTIANRATSGDNNCNIVSFDFRVMTPGKNLEHAQNAKSDS